MTIERFVFVSRFYHSRQFPCRETPTCGYLFSLTPDAFTSAPRGRGIVPGSLFARYSERGLARVEFVSVSRLSACGLAPTGRFAARLEPVLGLARGKTRVLAIRRVLFEPRKELPRPRKVARNHCCAPRRRRHRRLPRENITSKLHSQFGKHICQQINLVYTSMINTRY